MTATQRDMTRVSPRAMARFIEALCVEGLQPGLPQMSPGVGVVQIDTWPGVVQFDTWVIRVELTGQVIAYRVREGRASGTDVLRVDLFDQQWPQQAANAVAERIAWGVPTLHLVPKTEPQQPIHVAETPKSVPTLHLVTAQNRSPKSVPTRHPARNQSKSQQHAKPATATEPIATETRIPLIWWDDLTARGRAKCPLVQTTLLIDTSFNVWDPNGVLRPRKEDRPRSFRAELCHGVTNRKLRDINGVEAFLLSTDKLPPPNDQRYRGVLGDDGKPAWELDSRQGRQDGLAAEKPLDLSAATNLPWEVPPLRQAKPDKKRVYSDEKLIDAVRLWSEGTSIPEITVTCGFKSDGYTQRVLGQYSTGTNGTLYRAHEWLEPYRCKAILALLATDRVTPNGLQILLDVARRHGINVSNAHVTKMINAINVRDK